MNQEIWELSFSTKYKFLTIYMESLSEISDTIAANEKENYPHVEPEDEDLWIITLYFKDKPNFDEIKDQIENITREMNFDEISDFNLISSDDQEWTKNLEDNFKPIEVDEFFIFNPRQHKNDHDLKIAIAIGYFQAFGTGNHETTKACLKALLKFKTESSFNNILDLGTGSSILAIAAHRLWPNAEIVATDIDESAVRVANLNIELNDINIIKTKAEDGVGEFIGSFAPFDLVISNILAKPLIEMSESIKMITKSGSKLILSGFLISQVDSIIEAYSENNFKIIDQITEGDWASLILEKI